VGGGFLGGTAGAVIAGTIILLTPEISLPVMALVYVVWVASGAGIGTALGGGTPSQIAEGAATGALGGAVAPYIPVWSAAFEAAIQASAPQ
jgi:hypothetical protein